MKQDESKLQIEVFKFLDLALPSDYRAFAIPNGGLRNKITAARMKREGVKAERRQRCENEQQRQRHEATKTPEARARVAAINDAQWAAAGRFRQYWERSGAKGTVAIDYGREQVDGGKGIDPLPDSMIDAVQRLNECKPVLGRKAFDLMIKVVGQGMEISDIATTQREKTTYSDYIKDGLDALAVHWGYKTH